jgi:hypothetical protein
MCILCNEELIKKLNIKELNGATAEIIASNPEDEEHIREVYRKALEVKYKELWDAGFFH